LVKFPCEDLSVTEFDTDTALEARGDGLFVGEVTDRWMIGGGPNGGYIASFLMRGLAGVSPQPNPLSITIHFVGRPEPGPCEVRVGITTATRSHAFMDASLSQGGTVRAHCIAVFGQRRDDQLVDILRTSPATSEPGVGSPREKPPAGMPFAATFLDRFDYRAPWSGDLFASAPDEPAVVGGWTRLVDRDLDELAIPLFCDCWPPPMFRRHGPGMAPTIELTVHFRHNPEPRGPNSWYWCAFESRTLAGGYVEEDGEVWSEAGVLIAQSRQLSRFTVF
jgi:acyl-Coa thioesterase superfamily protein/acyl-CoA thioesterase superfamily protein